MSDFFNTLSSLVNKKKIEKKSIEKDFSSYMAMSWLSNNMQAAYQANKFNILPLSSSMSKLVQYNFIKENIKIKRNTFIKFKKTDKDIEIIREAVARYYNVNNFRAKEYMKLLNKEEIRKILTTMSYSGNDYINDPFISNLRKAIMNLQKRK